jgi:hypothetical protein
VWSGVISATLLELVVDWSGEPEETGAVRALASPTGPQRASGDRRTADPVSRAGRILALQRSAGNAAVSRLLQRKPALSDPVDKKYKDDKLDSGKTELNYIGLSGRKGRGVFMPHGAYEKLAMPGRLAAVRRAYQERPADEKIQPVEAMSDEAVARQIIPLLWSEIAELLQEMYIEGDDGELKKFVVRSANDPQLNFVALVNASLHGPLLRDESHGARLPSAQGTLHVVTPNQRYHGAVSAPDRDALRDDVLLAVGVRRGDLANYVNVAVQVVMALPGGGQVIDAADVAAQLEYVSGARTPAAREWVYAAGGWFQPDFSDASPQDRKRLQASWDALKGPTPSGPIKHDDLAKMDRAGQSTAMGNWNAFGAMAWAKNVANVPEAAQVDLKQHFEWLHVRASSLGGESVQGNLVTGSFVTNSAMTPWEAKLLKWKKQTTGPAELSVTFKPTAASKGPLAKAIDIVVSAKAHPVLQDLTDAIVVTFDPITGTVLDRMSYAAQKTQGLTNRRKPYSTRPEYTPAIKEVQTGVPLTDAKPAHAADADYDIAVRRLRAGEPPANNPAAAAADTAYRNAVALRQAGFPVGGADPAALAASADYSAAVNALQGGQAVALNHAAQQAQQEYTNAIAALQGGNPVGPGAAAQRAQQDYTNAITALQGGNPVGPGAAAQQALQDYTNAIAAHQGGNPVGPGAAAQQAVQDYANAVAAMQAGNAVGADPAAQAALADYDNALTVLAGWHPDNPVPAMPPPQFAVPNTPGAVTAANDYMTAWSAFYGVGMLVGSRAEATARESRRRKMLKAAPH